MLNVGHEHVLGDLNLQTLGQSPDDALLQKPFTPSALAMKIREVLDRRYLFTAESE